MADPIVISQLKKKREEIERAITDLEIRLRDMRADVATVNGTLRIFGEETGEPRVYLDRLTLFRTGELIRIAYDALREAPDGLDTTELADIAMARKGYDPGDRMLRARVKHSVTNAMLRYASKGKIAAGEMRKGVRVWRAARPA
jgi:hypothetical protein